MKDEKLQKALARMGLGSRRQMEEVIRSGRVSVNNAPATIGDRVQQGDEIRVDGRQIKYNAENEKRRRVLAYYKPEGEVCSAKDPEGRPTVFERLPKLTHDRWVMVGRLDINSTGLLLFTNDGEMAHRLMHPSSEVTREYAVRVLGEVTPDIARNLTAGVMLEDGMAQFEDIKEGGGEGVNKWYHVKLKEGRNREVRRLFESQGPKGQPPIAHPLWYDLTAQRAAYRPLLGAGQKRDQHPNRLSQFAPALWYRSARRGQRKTRTYQKQTAQSAPCR